MFNYLSLKKDLSKSAYRVIKHINNGNAMQFDKVLLDVLYNYPNDLKGIFHFVAYQYTYYIKTPLNFQCKDYILKEDLPDNYFRLYFNKTKISPEKLDSTLKVRAYCRWWMRRKRININELIFNLYIDNLLIAEKPVDVFRCANIAWHVCESTAIPMSIWKNIEAKIKKDNDSIKYCVFKENLTLSERNIAMSEAINERISKYYDPKLTDVQNAEKAGVCFNTFKKWAIENNKTKKDRHVQEVEYVRMNYDTNLTIKQNFESPVMQYLNISFSTFKRILKEIKNAPECGLNQPYQPEIVKSNTKYTEEKETPQNDFNQFYFDPDNTEIMTETATNSEINVVSQQEDEIEPVNLNTVDIQNTINGVFTTINGWNSGTLNLGNDKFGKPTLVI